MIIVYQPEWTDFNFHDGEFDGSVYRPKLTSIPKLTSVRCASLPASVSCKVVQLVVQSHRWLYTCTVARTAVHLVVPVPRKVDIWLAQKGNSNFYVARLVHQIISMMKWVRTRRLSIMKSLFASGGGGVRVHGVIRSFRRLIDLTAVCAATRRAREGERDSRSGPTRGSQRQQVTTRTFTKPARFRRGPWCGSMHQQG